MKLPEKIECWKVMIDDKSIMLRYKTKDDYTHLGLSYELGKKSTPKTGKIFCFLTREQAGKFASVYVYSTIENSLGQKVQVAKGIATNPVVMKKIPVCYYDIENFWLFKMLKKRKTIFIQCEPLPEGTICVDSFTPSSIENVGFGKFTS